jgi:hypothetical protein
MGLLVTYIIGVTDECVTAKSLIFTALALGPISIEKIEFNY